MLQRARSKKIGQLKYLLLAPLVLGMLLYTSLEAQESESIQQEQTSDDAALIYRLNAKIDSEIEKLGSINKVYHEFRKKEDFFGDDYLMSKDDYFERALLSERYFTKYTDSLEKARTPFFYRKMSFPKIPLPSTARYKSYVQRIKAFLILDKNLKFSIVNNSQNVGTSVRLLDENESFSKGHDVFRVADVKDLTGEEVRAFNNKLDEIFEQNDSGYSGLILTDGDYTFEVFRTKPFTDLEESEDNTKLSRAKSTTIDRYNQLVAERKRLLKSSNENNPVILNLDQQIRALKQSIDGESNVVTNTKDDVTVKYNLLLAERKRLLKSADEKNPVIVNLDQQIEALRKMVFGDGETVPFAIVEQVPVFPGCEEEGDKRACFREKMQRHISMNFSYPKEAQEEGIQGTVGSMFTISETGAIKNIKVRGPHRLLEDEAQRILSLLPEMEPGKHKGVAVNVPFSIPISFEL